MESKKSKIYKNPTVKIVIFQIRYSNLFMIENKIGDYQTKIIEKFPESSFTVKREMIFADVGPEFKMEEIKPKETIGGRKIWKFRSNNRYELNVLTNSLDISSKKHKSYYGNGESEGFRDIIKFAVDNFLDLIPIKTIKRIGLRYVDDSPIPPLDTTTFKEWYNTALPLNRFKIDEVGSMNFEVRNVKSNGYEFNYKEQFFPEKAEGSSDFKNRYTLDFDGYATNISAESYLEVLDKLHDLIHNEWENNTIKQPVKDWMEKDKEET